MRHASAVRGYALIGLLIIVLAVLVVSVITSFKQDDVSDNPFVSPRAVLEQNAKDRTPEPADTTAEPQVWQGIM